MLRQILNGELKAADLLPDAIVVITVNGKKINPANGKAYSETAIKAAKTILTLPANGREAIK